MKTWALGAEHRVCLNGGSDVAAAGGLEPVQEPGAGSVWLTGVECSSGGCWLLAEQVEAAQHVPLVS